jgi:hypothetical protein
MMQPFEIIELVSADELFLGGVFLVAWWFITTPQRFTTKVQRAITASATISGTGLNSVGYFNVMVHFNVHTTPQLLLFFVDRVGRRPSPWLCSDMSFVYLVMESCLHVRSFLAVICFVVAV